MRKLAKIAMISGVFFSAAINAHEADEFFVRVGAAHVAPDASSGSVLGGGVDVEEGTSLGFSGTWFLSQYLGIEVLAALPFEHDIVGSGALDGVDIGSTKHLPPTVSLQYYPLGDSNFQPYLGVGINYTTFFSTKTSNTLDTALGGGSELSLDDSVGVAFQVGADIKIGENLYLNAGVWKIDIETTADLSANNIEDQSVDVTIDPLVFMLGVGFGF